ncbi:MAG TPA: MMPL family transporter [Gaiellaceae bacterium]
MAPFELVGLTERLARACSRHPRRVYLAWLGVLVLSLAAIALLLRGLTTEATVTGNPESTRASKLIARNFAPDPRELVTDIVVVRSDRYTADAPQFRAFVADVARRGRDTGKVMALGTNIAKPPVSRDRHTVAIPIAVGSDSDIEPIVSVVRSADRNPDFRVTVSGTHTIADDFNKLSEHDLRAGELRFGLPSALVILVLVFGAVVAGVVPVVMAILSIVVAMGLVSLLSQGFDLSIFIVNMIVGMGLALGIDYSLFVISRYREERGRGLAEPEAIAMAGATASRAVLFSGSAFVVALLGMLIVPTTIMRSLAAGAILVGIVSVAAALTLLPAVLGSLGDGVNRLRVPIIGRASVERSDPEGRMWRAIVDRVLRRPAVSLAVAAALLLAAASPVFGLKIGASGVQTLPDRLESKQGYIALQRDFPQLDPSPARIVITGAAYSAVDKLRARLAADSRFGAGLLRTSRDVSLLTVPVRGDAVGKQAVAAVRDLRHRILPAALAGTGAEAVVGGKTAENIDYFDAVTNPAPLVFAFVLGLTLVLLTVAFRSIVVALTAIVLNLLSVGAAYGLLVLVSLHGVATGILGFQKVDVIDAWVPLFLFSVLFGLSMDYQVFLLSRIKERFDHTGDTAEAVASGVASTARIITGAALIIVAVFCGFAAGDLVMFQQMGFGVAAALLIDATIIRSVVLPSMMKLIGRWNWYLPSWLEWLPHVEVERAPARAQPEVV